MAWSLPFLFSAEDRISEKAPLLFERRGGNVALFPDYKWDPVGFARDVLGVELWECQAEIAQLVAGNPRVSVAACYASGKTFLAAVLVLWWLFTRPVCLVVTTAPTGRQVKELLWAEIGNLHENSKIALGGKILTRETRLGKSRRGFGVAGDGKRSKNAGYHTPSGMVLFIVDEKAGMERDRLNDFDGLLVDEEECREMGIGNPVSTKGPFFEEHVRPRGDVVLYNISALRTPNLTGAGEDRKRFPGLVSRSWVESRRKRWGEKHPLWITKVLGRFWVPSGAQKVVPESWITEACKRWSEILEGDGGGALPAGMPDRLGADVAGKGQNLTVLYRLRGRRLFFVDSWAGSDTDEPGSDGKRGTMLTALKIVQWAERLGVKEVCIDSQGLGVGIADRVQEYQDAGRLKGIQVNPVAMGDGAVDSDNYSRVVDEVQFAMRRAFDPDNPRAIAIDPNAVELIEQLPLRGWDLVGDGEDSPKIKVTRKRDLIEEGHDSPDHADAASLCFYETSNNMEAFFF